jgi:formiminoglutamase
MYPIQLHTKDEIALLTAVREGEEKLGQVIQTVSRFEDALVHPARFAVLGIPEDIGPRANKGKPGAHTAYADFLQSFVNIQHNGSLASTDVLLLGRIDVADLQEKSTRLNASVDADLKELWSLVEAIDKRVVAVVKPLIQAGKIPIVIGGGHNNAFPMLQAASQSGIQPLGAVNIDPHSDLRPTLGRHSGNGFSHAFDAGYLQKYFTLGLHLNYNNRAALNRFAEHPDALAFLSQDEIIKHQISLTKQVERALNHLKHCSIGLEVDLDAVPYAESSAKTPAGFDIQHLRGLVMLLASQKKCVYFNISEGIHSDASLTGKMISYLVTDFIRNTPA